MRQVSRSLSQCQCHLLQNAYLAIWTLVLHAQAQGNKLGQGHLKVKVIPM